MEMDFQTLNEAPRRVLGYLTRNRKWTYGVFALPNSNSCADSYTDSDVNGLYDNVQNCLHWTYTDSYSDSNGFCTQFGTNISTDKVEFQWRIQDYSEVGAPTLRGVANIQFCQNFPKTAWNWKNLDPQGYASPLRSAIELNWFPL